MEAVKDFNEMEFVGIGDGCPGMSNLGHVIDEGFAEALKAKPGEVYGQHSAWDFCGLVWFEDGKFHEQINVYHVAQEVIEADTLEELMELANEKYGSA